ncbi:MAG: pseudouridine synthase [Bacteriovoracaceae bacterium]
MSTKNISCCSLVEDESIESFLIKNFNISPSKIKKSSEKKRLQKKVFFKSELDIPIDLINVGKINPIYQGELMDILFEDDNFLVINKLPGVHSVPLEYSDTLNSLSFLIQQQKWSVINTNQNQLERGLLHRLDLGTSGVLIFAQNDLVYNDVRKNFQNFSKEKIYFAVVNNKFSKNGTHIHYLQPHLARGKKMRVIQSGELRAEMEANFSRV